MHPTEDATGGMADETALIFRFFVASWYAEIETAIAQTHFTLARLTRG